MRGWARHPGEQGEGREVETAAAASVRLACHSTVIESQRHPMLIGPPPFPQKNSPRQLSRHLT